MPTEHCTQCESAKPCGNGHLYVIEFLPDALSGFVNKPQKGFLYVGSTGKSVEQRFRDTFTRLDGKYVSFEEIARFPEAWPEDGAWKYNTRNSKRIRRYYLRHRPDLFYYMKNPILCEIKDPGKLERWETKLARKLRNKGWKVAQG